MNQALIEREVQRAAQLRDNLRRRGTLSRNVFVPQGDPTARGFAEGVAEAGLSAADAATFGALPYISAGLTGRDVEELVNTRNAVTQSTGGQLGGLAADFGVLSGLGVGVKKAGSAIADRLADAASRNRWQKGLTEITNLIVDNKLIPGTARYRLGDVPSNPFNASKFANNAQSFEMAAKLIAEGMSPRVTAAEVANKFGTDNQTIFVLNNIDKWFKGKEKARILNKFKDYSSGKASEADVVEYLEGKMTPAAVRGFDRFHSLDKRPVDLTEGLTPQMLDDMLRYINTGGVRPPGGETPARQRLRAYDEADSEQVKMLLQGLNEQERNAALDAYAKRLTAAETKSRNRGPRKPDEWDDFVRRNTGPDKPIFDPRLLSGGKGGAYLEPTEDVFTKLLAKESRLNDISPQTTNVLAQLQEGARFGSELARDRSQPLLSDLMDPVIGPRVLDKEVKRGQRRFDNLGMPGPGKTRNDFREMGPAERELLEKRAMDAEYARLLLDKGRTPAEAAEQLMSLGNADRAVLAWLRSLQDPRNRDLLP